MIQQPTLNQLAWDNYWEKIKKYVAWAKAKHSKTDLSVTPKVVGEESKPV